MNSTLQKEFQYYIDHQDELVKRYSGRVIVIKDQTVIGDFGSDLEAVQEVSKKHKLGTFLVQKCEAGRDSYTQTFNSRVVFA
jgi:hypothetical protein